MSKYLHEKSLWGIPDLRKYGRFINLRISCISSSGAHGRYAPALPARKVTSRRCLGDIGINICTDIN